MKVVPTEDLTGISGSVPKSLHLAMEDARWGYKRNMSQMVRAAVEFYAEHEGFWTPPEPITSDDPELTDDQRAAVLADEERAAKAAEADGKADGDVDAAKDTAAKLAEDKAAEDKAAADKVAEDKATKTTSGKAAAK